MLFQRGEALEGFFLVYCETREGSLTALQTSVTAHHGFEELPGPGVEAAADPHPRDVLAEAGGAHGDETGEAGVAGGQGHHVPHYVVIRRVPAIMDHGHIAGEDLGRQPN